MWQALDQKNQKYHDAAYGALCRSGVLHCLADFDASLAGTFPLGLGVATSDLDILCEIESPERLLKTCGQYFSQLKEYTCKQSVSDFTVLALINFQFDGVPFEIYGQNCPVQRNRAFLHFDVERRLLKLMPIAMKLEVLKRKESGIKTEPAFAEVLNLDGDPYETLEQLASRGDDELMALLPVDITR